MPQTRSDILEKISRAFSVSDFSEGQMLCQNWLCEHPDDEAFLRIQAEMLRRQQKLPEAIAVMEKLAGLAPFNVAYLNDLGVMHAQLAKWQEAIAFYRMALSAQSDFLDAKYNLALALFSTASLEEAENTILDLERRAPDYPGASDLKAEILNMRHPPSIVEEEDFCLPPSQVWAQGERIRLLFIVQHPMTWANVASVIAAAQKDERFLPLVVLSPHLAKDVSSFHVYDHMKSLLLKEHIPFCPVSHFDLALFKPHVAFVPTPYEATRDASLDAKSLRKAGARIAYIPYGLEIGGSTENLSLQFNLATHRLAWRIFARSLRHQNMFGRHCERGNAHVVVTGHPKFDAAGKVSLKDIPAIWQAKAAGRKVLLWTPHHSITSENDTGLWSTFLRFGPFILDEVARRGDVFLLVRPHPMFFKNMIIGGFWQASDARAFRARIEESPHTALDEAHDHNKAFLFSDALMEDVGSFLLEYLPTHKPLLYLHCPKGCGMNEDGDIVHHLYKAFETKDISDFIQMVSEAKDPMREERLAVIPEFLQGLDGKVGERICNEIYKGMVACDPGHARWQSLENECHTQAQDFWTNAPSSDATSEGMSKRKEAALQTVLQGAFYETALDLGCGDGRLTCALARHAKRVSAVDMSHALIERARARAQQEKLTHIQFQTEHLENFSLRTKFDCVVCMGVTSCFLDPVLFLNLLDKIRLFCHKGATLLIGDTLSLEGERQVLVRSAPFVCHRTESEYVQAILRRGFVLKKRVVLEENPTLRTVHPLFVFELFNDPASPEAI